MKHIHDNLPKRPPLLPRVPIQRHPRFVNDDIDSVLFVSRDAFLPGAPVSRGPVRPLGASL